MAPEFHYSDLLPIGPDETQYRFLGNEGVEVVAAAGRTFITVTPEAITKLTEEAIHDINH